MKRGTLEVGDSAPPIDAQSTDGRRIRLADYQGRYVVLYFFPKAFTPGCTAQARRFRDNYPELRELGAEVIGVSVDDQATQCDFANRERVKFPMIGDADEAISRAYGTRRAFLPFDKRVTFVIDPDGKVAATFHHELQISKHLDEVLHFLRARKQR
ncbi:MAG: peroxiredoxin [Sandaracinaceae bacterium]|nr:peroxiredoxin [Sandaracinaceae bacterium]